MRDPDIFRYVHYFSNKRQGQTTKHQRCGASIRRMVEKFRKAKPLERKSYLSTICNVKKTPSFEKTLQNRRRTSKRFL